MRWAAILVPFAALALTGSAPAPVPLGPDALTTVRPWSRGAIPASLYISGHSLIDRPYGDYLALLATHDGGSLRWDMQYMGGSSLQDRALGTSGELGSGYRRGTDASGNAADVSRILEPHGVPPPDALLLTEQHTLLESLIWKDMIPNAVDYVGRFRAANPDGRTYLFTSWLNFDNADDPARWISYERAADLAWQCAATRIERLSNARVTLVPAAEALAALVEKSLADELPGISKPSPRETMRTLFADDVHLTPTGTYFTALVTHGVLGGALTGAVPSPPEIAPETAEALQRFARDYLDRRGDAVIADEAACRAYLGKRFAPEYLAYVHDLRWRSAEGPLRAYLKWARFRVAWPHLLQSDRSDNPFANRLVATSSVGGENPVPVLPNALNSARR